jgi:hypothetical protein
MPSITLWTYLRARSSHHFHYCVVITHMGFFQRDRKNDGRVQVVYRSDYLWHLWYRTFLAETPLQRDRL